jgi:hypothetical protein
LYVWLVVCLISPMFLLGLCIIAPPPSGTSQKTLAR